MVVPMVALMAGYFSELSLVNECISAQGSFDYIKQTCDFQVKQPFIPYFKRNPDWVNSAFVLSLLGLMMCFFGLYRRRM